MKKLLLFLSHLIFAAIGFAAGIYTLPILTAPKPPTQSEMDHASSQAKFTAEFKRDLAGSGFLHWGEGTVSVGDQFISLSGKIAPGPDYKLYLSPVFVEDEAQFNAAKNQMVRVGDVKTFSNFVVSVPPNTSPTNFTTVVIWCEAFGEFITAAKYQ